MTALRETSALKRKVQSLNNYRLLREGELASLGMSTLTGYPSESGHRHIHNNTNEKGGPQEWTEGMGGQNDMVIF